METTAITPGSIDPHTDQKAGFQGLDGEDFFKLLVAQLANQDPLEPTSNQELLNQISSIRDIEASTTLTRTLQSLVTREGFGSAAGLIGQYVSGTINSDDGETVSTSGTVVGLRVDPNGDVMLLLDTGEALPMSNVDHVTTARHFAEAFMGRLVSGIDRTDPQRPEPVEGIVTGVTTDANAQVVLELDGGEQLRLADVSATSALADGDADSVVGPAF